MMRTPCDFDRCKSDVDWSGDDARGAITAMLRCAARHACDRSLVCSDTAIDLLNRLVLRGGGVVSHT